MDVAVITSQAMQELSMLLFRTGLLKPSKAGDEERLSPPIQEDLSMLQEGCARRGSITMPDRIMQLLWLFHLAMITQLQDASLPLKTTAKQPSVSTECRDKLRRDRQKLADTTFS